MSRAISVPDDVYYALKEEAASENRSMSRQLREWAKMAEAKRMAELNNATIEDCLDVLEASERCKNGKGIIIEDL